MIKMTKPPRTVRDIFPWNTALDTNTKPRRRGGLTRKQINVEASVNFPRTL